MRSRSRSRSRSRRSRQISAGAGAGAGAVRTFCSEPEPEPEPSKKVSAPAPKEENLKKKTQNMKRENAESIIFTAHCPVPTILSSCRGCLLLGSDDPASQSPATSRRDGLGFTSGAAAAAET